MATCRKLHCRKKAVNVFSVKPQQFFTEMHIDHDMVKTWTFTSRYCYLETMKSSLAFSSPTFRLRKNILAHFPSCWPIHSSGPQPSGHLVFLTLDDLRPEISKLPFWKLFTMKSHWVWVLRHLTLGLQPLQQAWEDCCELANYKNNATKYNESSFWVVVHARWRGCYHAPTNCRSRSKESANR